MVAAHLLGTLLLLSTGVATAFQCDWHLRSMDVTLMYNNEVSASYGPRLQELLQQSLQHFAELASDELRVGHTLTISGKRFTAGDRFLKDREGNSLDICTQRDTWSGVFTRTELDTSELERLFAEQTWFNIFEGNAEGEDLALLAIAERLRDVNMHHANRVNLQLIFTERPPLYFASRCDQDISALDVLNELQRGGNALLIIPDNEMAANGWAPLCNLGLCTILEPFRFSSVSEGVNDVFNKITNMVSALEDKFNVGPCNCFAEDVVNMKFSWLWPRTVVSLFSKNILNRWRLRMDNFIRSAMDATMNGGSVDNYVSIRTRSYGEVAEPCGTPHRVSVDLLSRDTTDQAWTAVGDLLRESPEPIISYLLRDKGALNSINIDFLAPQLPGEVQIISIFADREPFLQSGPCAADPNLARMKSYLYERPQKAAYLLIYAFGVDEVIEEWQLFCETELPGRCEVIDLVSNLSLLAPEAYAAKMEEIRSLFACEKEAEVTLPPTIEPIIPYTTVVVPDAVAATAHLDGFASVESPEV